MKIYLIEDHKILRNTLSALLTDFCPGVKVIGASDNGKIATLECLELKPDLIILGIQLTEVNGVEILRLLKRKFPQVKILIYSSFADQQTVDIAVRGKANGYLTKEAGFKELGKAINAVAAGDTYFSSDLHNMGVPIKLLDH